MNRYTRTLITSALIYITGLITTQAADKIDPTGTWKWTATGQNGQTRDMSVKLKADGDKLTGSMPGRNGETQIDNGKIDGDKITFDVTREFNGNKRTQKFNGKISGDTITGKIESDNNGETRSRDWTAKRDGASGASNSASKDVTGSYKYTVNTPNGQSFEPTLKLKQDGNKITGTVAFNDRETEIMDGKIDGDKITFKTERERNGNKVTSSYDAKLDGGNIKGKITSNFGGNDRTYDFDAKKQ